MSKIKVALIQLDSQNNKAVNLEKITVMIEQACKEGATFVLLPETFNLRRAPDTKAQAETLSGPTIQLLKKLALSNGIHLLAGSLCEKPDPDEMDSEDEGHVYNTSVLIDPEGRIKATYRKIHLFVSHLKDAAISESHTFMSGSEPVLTEVGDVMTGLSICYDLRFPELYRQYSLDGAQILTVPSSFTALTGEAHWEVLLRARAIENLAYVLAPNQVGLGSGGVATYGNSMIVDPWGKVIARASHDQEEVLIAELDLDQLRDYRKSFPVLSHVRL